MPPTRNDDPASLEAGTEVSARFNGAFCEAKIRSVSLDIRIKVRDASSGELFTVKQSSLISSLKTLRIGSPAIVKHPNTHDRVEVAVLQVIDYSYYTVIFNDGDEKSLKRSSLHPKSGRHYDESISLDNMPLTQPEKNQKTSTSQVPAPDGSEDSVSLKSGTRSVGDASMVEAEESDLEATRRSTRQRKAISYAKPASLRKKEKSGADQLESDSSQTDKGSAEEIPAVHHRKPRSTRKSLLPSLRDSSGEDDEDETMVKVKMEPSPSTSRRRSVSHVVPPSLSPVDVVEKPIKKEPGTVRPAETAAEVVEKAAIRKEPGQVVSYDFPIRSIVCIPQTGRKKFKWLPALVVHPESRKKGKVDSDTELLVRLFNSGNYVKVRKDQVKAFSELLYSAPDDERVPKFNPDYALQYFRDQTLPPTWQTTSLFTSYDQHEGSEDNVDGDAALARDDLEDESEATRFMIQFIKFRDESGHPYDDPAEVNGKPVDMYQLYRAVHSAGGYNRCGQENKWAEICQELDIPEEGAASLKDIYHRYLHGSFESIFRQLASSITDIRLGRKRHQHTPQESNPPQPVASEPERHTRVQSPQPPKKTRGRPPGSSKLGHSVSVESVKTKEAKEITPDLPREDQLSEPSQIVVKKEFSEESTSNSLAESDESWTAIRNRVAPGAPPIVDTSVLRSGAIVEVLYRNKKAKKILAYHARILDNVGDVAYYVHYASWNKRYDEWIPLQAIIKVVDLVEVGAKQYILNSVLQSKIRNKLKSEPWDQFRPILDRLLADNPNDSSNNSSSLDQPEDASFQTPTTMQLEPKPSSPRRQRSSSGFSEDHIIVVKREIKSPESPEKLATDVVVAPSEILKEVKEAVVLLEPPLHQSSPILAKPIPATESISLGLEPLEAASFVLNSQELGQIPKAVEEQDGHGKGPTQSGRKRKSPARLNRQNSANKRSPRSIVAEPMPVIVEPEKVAVGNEVDLSQFIKTEEISPPRFVASSASNRDDQDCSALNVAPINDISGVKIKSSMEEIPSSSETVQSGTCKKEGLCQGSTEEVSLSLTSMKTKTSRKGLKHSISVAEEPETESAPTPETAAQRSTRRCKLEAIPEKPEVSRRTPESTTTVPVTDTPQKADSSVRESSPAGVRQTRRGRRTVESSALDVTMHLVKEPSPQVQPVAPIVVPETQPVLAEQVWKVEKEESVSSDPNSMTESVSSHAIALAASQASSDTLGTKQKSRKKAKPSPEPVCTVALRAPAFAAKHRAALERFGLPLDGSEATRETAIEEDDNGCLTKIMIEGIDLTEPDLQPSPLLTGAARIEAYEKTLNDVLLVSQLLIHRLATGYHILKRHENKRNLADVQADTDSSGSEGASASTQESTKKSSHS